MVRRLPPSGHSPPPPAAALSEFPDDFKLVAAVVAACPIIALIDGDLNIIKVVVMGVLIYAIGTAYAGRERDAKR